MWETLWICGKKATAKSPAQAFGRQRIVSAALGFTWLQMGKDRCAENTTSVMTGDNVRGTDARADLSVDSNVLTHRTMSPPVGDNESDVWVSCGLALIGLHESNPPP
jgi:hypothetical protein